ncbi:MAG: UDP-N-acetylmuramoyl-L-alanyl-D-glutamate--2,6-diaminopimelate ligase, partial [Betaproteobacteria bacterium]|nr:UDP-N-acetylmuramoyl-L-alanyl-D-glutamate--2,6-diaminopimelate ligase [Betaproteobacteria bacterium]
MRELFCDSRRMRRGGIFVAYPGRRADGRGHIAEALRAGASGVFWEAEGFSWPSRWKTPNVPVPALARRAGLLADAVYGAPSRRLFTAAITGTNGKTTASFFAAKLLRQSKIPAGCIGTLGAGMAEDSMIPTDNTTPDAISLHGFLRDFAAAGAKAAVLEASSHGIVQRRLSGIRLAAAALLNIGRDHLDYHGAMQSYRRAKTKLLRTEGLQTAAINADDARCVQAAEQCRAPNIWTFGKKGKTLRLISAAPEKDGMRLKLDGAWGKKEARLRVLGAHNADNFMAAALIAAAAGASWEAFRPHELTPP